MINRNEIKAGSGAPASASTTRIIAKFKTPQEIEERNAFIAGAEAARKDSIDIWKSSDLKKLTLEALLDRLERVDNQASLLRWKIFSAIRAHFLSDKLYGQYLAELRENPNYAGLIGTQQDAHRSACAGRFCEKHGINNLNDAGILKSTVYARLIAQAKAITGEVVPEVQVIDYDNIGNVQEPGEKVRHLRRAIQLENGKIPGLMVEQQCDALTDMMANAFADAEAVTKVDYEAPEEDFEEEVEAVHIHIERAGVEESVLHNATDDDLLLELASRRAVGLTPEQMANEILLLSERFGLSSIKLIPIMQLCTRHLQSSSYFRKTGGAA
jgi:hypothetical protein